MKISIAYVFIRIKVTFANCWCFFQSFKVTNGIIATSSNTNKSNICIPQVVLNEEAAQLQYRNILFSSLHPIEHVIVYNFTTKMRV